MSQRYSLLTVRMFEDDYYLFRDVVLKERNQMSKVTRKLIMSYIKERIPLLRGDSRTEIRSEVN